METWICDNCGWTCQVPTGTPVDEAECDNCGDDELRVMEPDTSGISGALY